MSASEYYPNEVGFWRSVDEQDGWIAGENIPDNPNNVQNDLLGRGFGTCALAECGNHYSIVTTFNGRLEKFDDGAVEHMYHKLTDFLPTDPSTDRGVALETVLKEWRDNGWSSDPGLKIGGYHEVSVNQIRDTIVRYAACEAWFRLSRDIDGNLDLSDNAVQNNVIGTTPHAMLIVASGPGYWRVVTYKTVRIVSDAWMRAYGMGYFAVEIPGWQVPIA